MKVLRPAKVFTKSIHRTLGIALEDRAYFLKKLYDEIANGITTEERYLDVGAARATNAKVFGEGFHKVYCLDINFIDQQGQEPKIQFIIGDAQTLPLKENTIDFLSLFSAIEHLPSPQQALNEAIRVLQPNGELVIQVPNRFFPIDLHTGIPNPFWIPKFARKTYLKIMGHSDWLNNVHGFPRQKDITGWLRGRMQLTGVRKVIYPPLFVPRGTRPIYILLTKVKFFTLIPLVYLYVYKNTQHSAIKQ